MKRKQEMPEEEDEVAMKQPRLTFPHAFKFLAPEALSSAIIGVKGAGVQEIQQNTDSRISVADRNDRYQSTNSRLVLVRAQTPQAIDAAISACLEKVKGLVDYPRKGQDATHDTELVGRGAGEYKLKIVVPKAAAGAVIGTKGANVKELCELTGCRVRVEELKGGGMGDSAEQIVSLLGPLESLIHCAIKVNYFVQECASQPYFQDWAHLNTCKGSGKGGGAAKGGMGMYNGGSVGIRGIIGGGVNYSAGLLGDDEMLMRTMRQMPRHLTDAQTFALQASLPIDSMSGLIGKGGSGTKEINQQTGAKVTLRNDEPNCTVLIEGSLNSALSAYMLIMKRYLELDQMDQISKGKDGGGKGKGKGKGKKGLEA
eukprot:GEMP01028936.1.p1 GENE.GEMP01028936.1~~GEMP01028936.1.p1  ORF type:complete len:370 (+),score=94.40 GEMP01028936.1:334-1443(+)